MPVKNDREYRNLGTFQTSEDFMVEGYASTFDKYKMMTIDGVEYYEQIDRHAFDEADMSDVVFLRDHEGRVLARTKNDAIKLSIDEHGLHHITDLGLTGASREMYEDIQAGNYQQMSFSFVVAEDRYDKETHTRLIEKVSKVYDISAVAYPANPFTEIGVSARDYFNGVIEMEKAERLENEKARLKLKTKLARSMK